jgi:hypothetical protein
LIALINQRPSHLASTQKVADLLDQLMRTKGRLSKIHLLLRAFF